jgi:hypothetical protein
MYVLWLLGGLYIGIGIYLNWCMMDVMIRVPVGHKYHGRAQMVISKLIVFSSFSMAIFRWPGLIRTIYSGGNDGV